VEKKVLFDWDTPCLSGRWALKQGIILAIYGVLKILGIDYPKAIVNETDDYAFTLLKLNDMLGIKTVIGVQDRVKAEKSQTIKKIIEAGYDVRRHTHISESPDTNRQRLWEPPLNQPPHTWHYDVDYIKGNSVKILPGELPIWHFDRPYHLKNYIDFLYNEFYKGE